MILNQCRVALADAVSSRGIQRANPRIIGLSGPHQSLIPEMIPIYLSSGELYRHIDPDQLKQHQAHFRLVRNKRGHITRAYLKQAISCDVRPTSTIGLSFEQSLCSGHVWALRGVRGSRAAA